MTPRPDPAAHRKALLSRLPADEALLVFGGRPVARNADSEHRYRPNADVLWLTGWEEPDVAVFLRPGQEPFTLFCQPRDEAREAWVGVRQGPEGAVANWGADRAHSIQEIADVLPELLQGVSRLHYAVGEDAHRDRMVVGAVSRATRAARRNGLDIPEIFCSPRLLLHELRLVKDEAEIAILREAARVTGIAFRAAMALTSPGRREYEIEALVDWIYRSNGGTGSGFTTIAAAGSNACTLHYVRNDACLEAGDLLLVDSGCEMAWYTADVSRTFPVSGAFTGPQKALYQLVLDAQRAAIAIARPGRRYDEMHDAVALVLTRGMVDLGLLHGDVETLIAEEAYKRYFTHGTGHWLGLDVHDAGAYGRRGASRALEPGMVCTVEPGLYIGPGDESAPEAYRGIGIRIEDDVLVTEGAPEVLTASIPKEIDAVEAAMYGDRAREIAEAFERLSGLCALPPA